MNTIRAWLVASVTATLAAALLVFGAALYLTQRPERFRELDTRLRLQGDVVAALLGAPRARSKGGPSQRVQDSVAVASVGSLGPALQDYVIILNLADTVLYMSRAARDLPTEPIKNLIDLAKRGSPASLGSGDLVARERLIPVRYYTRQVRADNVPVALIIVAAPTAGVILTPQRLLPGMLLTAPLIIALASLFVYVLVDRTLQPVDAIVEEVEAISDGRSLHRRLGEPTTKDELARLTDTLNAMLARLERSFASLRRFTADASHELKTPLTVLRSGIERAITHPKAPPEVMAVLEETLVEVNRMAELVDALLTLARADEGRAPLHLEPMELEDILSEVSETASILGEQANVSVSVKVPPRPFKIAVDRSRIRQLLMNLLSNAIKYTPRGGSVAIDCSQTNGQVVLSVRDTGVGIAPGDLPHVFDRFWRADQARSRTGQRPGVGLGLAISKWIVEAHGGTITVQSRPGRGTTFTVTLPTGSEALAPPGSTG
jgi:heavy metal sensor kinase